MICELCGSKANLVQATNGKFVCSECISGNNHPTIKELNLDNKESIVRLLFDVQMGKMSCRRAATEIQKKWKEK